MSLRRSPDSSRSASLPLGIPQFPVNRGELEAGGQKRLGVRGPGTRAGAEAPRHVQPVRLVVERERPPNRYSCAVYPQREREGSTLPWDEPRC